MQLVDKYTQERVLIKTLKKLFQFIYTNNLQRRQYLMKRVDENINVNDVTGTSYLCFAEVETLFEYLLAI